MLDAEFPSHLEAGDRRGREGPAGILGTDVLIDILKRCQDLLGRLDPDFQPLCCASLSRRELL